MEEEKDPCGWKIQERGGPDERYFLTSDVRKKVAVPKSMIPKGGGRARLAHRQKVGEVPWFRIACQGPRPTLNKEKGGRLGNSKLFRVFGLKT